MSFKTEDDVIINGTTVNVSESGLLVTFEKPLELWINGEINMVVGEYIVNIQARTARMNGNDVGMSFLTETDNDRLAIKIMIEYAQTLKQSDVTIRVG